MMQTVKCCPFWNYWSTQIVNDTLTKGMNYDELLKTIKRFTKMLEIQYYNHPGQTTDWRLCYFHWLQCIYLRCPANQRTNRSYWKFSNTCKQDWIEKLPKPCKLHLPWTWIMLQTHFDHYRRQYGIAMVTQSLHNHSMQTNHNQIQTCNPWTRRLSNIIAINKRRLQINWTRRHQNDTGVHQATFLK